MSVDNNHNSFSSLRSIGTWDDSSRDGDYGKEGALNAGFCLECDAGNDDQRHTGAGPSWKNGRGCCEDVERTMTSPVNNNVHSLAEVCSINVDSELDRRAGLDANVFGHVMSIDNHDGSCNDFFPANGNLPDRQQTTNSRLYSGGGLEGGRYGSNAGVESPMTSFNAIDTLLKILKTSDGADGDNAEADAEAGTINRANYDLGIGTDNNNFDQLGFGTIVYQGPKSIIYRNQDGRGVKVLVDQNRPIEEQFHRLSHELVVSQHLPFSCHKRKVIDVSCRNGKPAMTFQWANGKTLDKWVGNVQNRHEEVDFIVRLRAAMAIVKTVADFHQGGVAINGIAMDNIVLDTQEGEYVATFIGLSGAVILRGLDNVGQEKMRALDLKDLGIILNTLFAGRQNQSNDYHSIDSGARRLSAASCSGHEEDLWGQSRAKRGKSLANYTSSIENGSKLPLILSSLISALLRSESRTVNESGSGTQVCYDNAEDAYLDLKAMLSTPVKLLKKCVWDEAAYRSQLQIQSNFYGRQVQMTLLMHVFNSALVIGGQPVMAIVSGYPGAGKSTLINRIKGPLNQKDGCFIEGKFSKECRPDFVLSSALDSFFGQFLHSSMQDSRVVSMRWRIHDAIGSSADNRFLNSMPNLKKFMFGNFETNAPESSDGVGIKSSERCKFLFVKVISAISCRSHPLVLFLDDLQWADEITLDIMRMIMRDPDINYFLLLGTYRENEVIQTHPLSSKLNELRAQGIQVHTITVGQLELENVNSLVSDALYLPPSLCRSLSSLVHSKTGGIILFVLQFLTSLNEEGLLWFNMTERRWDFDLERIRVKEISENVVEHMTFQMARLPRKMRFGLMLASFLGSNFDRKVLEKAKNEEEFDVDSFFSSSIEAGFLHYDKFSKRYVWAHDQIRQAAYELVPQAKRDSFHLLIGSRLFLRSSPVELKSNLLFCIVDNMNRGVHLMNEARQKYDLASLNLDAGNKSISASAFHSAERYLMTGISLLGNECWETKYNLALKLYDAASEALFVTGNFQRLSETTEEPLEKAKCFEDKLNIYHNLVRSLIAWGKHDECFSMCVNVLSQLGETLPTAITEEIYDEEARSMKKLMRGKQQQHLLSLPNMSNFNKLAAMQFLNHALTLTYIWKPKLSPLIVFRMVKLTMRYGVCNLSSFAFGVYGAWLVSIPRPDFAGGYRMGRAAAEVMKRLGATEITSRLYVVIYTFINIWKDPLQASLSKHLEGYDAGVMSGDTEYAISNLLQYALVATYGSGERLDGLASTIESYSKRALQCNQAVVGKFFLIALQLVLDLRGIDRNVYPTLYEGSTEDSVLATAQRMNDIQFCRAICIKKKYKAFLLGNMTVAAEMYELYQKLPVGSNAIGISHMVGKFIDGLIAFYFARKRDDDEKKWTKIGMAAMNDLRNWSTKSSWNFSNKADLLEAEYAFLKGKHEDAMTSYSSSIKNAGDHRFIHEEGLAYEKCATYLLRQNKHDEALNHLINAKRCYSLWGANALVARVDEAIAVLLPLCG